jgi:V/A-type H+-transporting ATPase subunit A
MVLETCKSIREDFLHQNAFHKVDTHTSIDKQYEILKSILHLHEQGLAAIKRGVESSDIFALKVREEIARSSYIPEEELAKVAGIRDTIDAQMKALSN